MSIYKYKPEVYVPSVTIMRALIAPDINVKTKKGEAEANRLIRAEYSRLRAIAVKRLERLSRSEFKSDMPYQRYKDRFLKLEEMTKKGGKYDYGKIARSLADVNQFLSLKSSTIKGAKQVRANILSGLREHGVDFVTEDNLKEFGDFMQLLRSKLLDRIYDSERAYKVYTQARKLGMKWHGDLEDEFDYFYHHSGSMKKLRKLSEAEKTEKLKGKTNTLAKYYRDQLERWSQGRLSNTPKQNTKRDAKNAKTKKK